MQLVQYLEISEKHSMRKQVVKNLIDCLVNDDALDEFCLENKIDMDEPTYSMVKLKTNCCRKNSRN